MTLPRRLVAPQCVPTAAAEAGSIRRPTRQFVVVFVVTVGVLWPAGLALAVSIGGMRWVIGRMRVRSARREVRRTAERQLPGVVSLMQLSLAAGHTPRDVVRVAANFARSPICDHLASVARRLEDGATFADALDDFDTVDGLGRVLRMLEHGEQHGQPLAPHLAALADDVRRARIAQIDEQSQRLTVQMLFPLVLCILPAFLLLSMLPLIVALFEGLDL